MAAPSKIDAQQLSDLGRRYSAVRRRTADLCSNLSPEDHMVQSTLEASPVKWHLAHSAWFFETFLLTPHLRGYVPLDGQYRSLFNSYYNAVGDRPARDTRGAMSRPSLEEVMAYRAHVDAAMRELLECELSSEVRSVVELGLNHEQQHQELIVTDAKHALWSNPLQPAFIASMPRQTSEVQPLRWIAFQEGVYEIGNSGDSFAFDNESPRHKVFIQPFELASRLVTNGEFLGFIHDGGYSRPELWLSDGWEAARSAAWNAPLYWEKRDQDWWHFTCSGMRRVDLSEPVCHVSFYEAEAYARWAGARLPREAEWELAAASLPVMGNLLESEEFHPAAARHDAPHDDGIQQLFGDCWEWTQSAYSAYPGYRPAGGALGEYNAKFMCNQMVLRGGSCATPQSHIRAGYRNFFPPQTRWQFSGIRLAKDLSGSSR